MRLLIACLTALSLMLPAVSAGAQEEPIQGTIQGQIDAFLADDFVTAFTFASPTIRSMFGTAENFGAMVRNGYPMVHRPSDVRMGELRTDEGLLWQRVFVTDAVQSTEDRAVIKAVIELASFEEFSEVHLSFLEQLTEIIELPREVHPWFVGVQFHPEFRSTPWAGHPLFNAFIKAALDHQSEGKNLKAVA